MYVFLRRFRLVFAVIFIVVFTLVFTDLGNAVSSIFKGLLKWQFVPALLGAIGGSAGILVFLLLLTLLFGRVYCSFLCPAGIFQDVVTFVANLFKNRKQRRYKYSQPHNILRYTLMSLTFALFIAGSAGLLLLLDPYSNYGRMAENVFRPAVTGLNNLGASWFSETFYSVGFKTFTTGSIIAGAVFFAVITVMSALRGRLYCNTLCPVGALLGLVSKYSFFQLSVDNEKCVHCLVCETKCKAQCINSKKVHIDTSRCVQCYNCTVACKHNALGLTSYFARRRKSDSNGRAGELSSNRRAVFLLPAGILATGIVARLFSPKLQTATDNPKAIAPPGAQSVAHLKRHCTACQVCIAKCPSQVLRPSLDEYGIDGFMMPVLNYRNSYCRYDCTECSTTCPNGALLPQTTEQKKQIQVGVANFIHANCVVVTDGTDCGACDEHCPTKAVHMVPYRDGLLIPAVNADICVGCGGCEYICPAMPAKAIVVKANPVHLVAALPEQDRQETKDIDDFGF
jgi:polyferredoxin